jgi:hypothetical protein
LLARTGKPAHEILAACDSATDKVEVVTAETAPVAEPVVLPEPVAGLEVSNPSEFARPDTLISLSLNQLGVSAGPLQVWMGDSPQPTQLVDDDGDSTPDKLGSCRTLAQRPRKAT